ncbi:MAG: glycosyltransferase family 4 protein [Bacteroidetes bacterium]|nr:glycosyltransferase family 4 protein [Bacteroidota bacterium]
MKTVFLGRYNQSENLTGPEKVAKRIFKIHSEKYSSVFIEYFFDGNQFGFLKKLFGSEIPNREKNPLVKRKGIISLFIFLIFYKPDIIHIINFERFAIAGILYKFISNAKIVYSVHGIVIHENTNFRKTDEKLYGRDKKTEEWFFRYSDRFFVLSPQSLKIVLSYYSISDKKIRMIPNGIDEEFSELYKTRKRTAYKPEISFIVSGNIQRPEKGIDRIKDVLSRVDFPNRLFYFGPFNQKITERSMGLKTMNLNIFGDLLINSDIVISASVYEPFSLFTVEAMACGVVPVVSEETGMSRYIEHGMNGFIVDMNDAEKLEEILNRLNSDRELLSSLSGNAANIYRELNWENVYNEYERVYLKLTEKKPD